MNLTDGVEMKVPAGSCSAFCVYDASTPAPHLLFRRTSAHSIAVWVSPLSFHHLSAAHALLIAVCNVVPIDGRPRDLQLHFRFSSTSYSTMGKIGRTDRTLSRYRAVINTGPVDRKCYVQF
jgi:hypothetical protein